MYYTKYRENKYRFLPQNKRYKRYDMDDDFFSIKTLSLEKKHSLYPL